LRGEGWGEGEKVLRFKSKRGELATANMQPSKPAKTKTKTFNKQTQYKTDPELAQNLRKRSTDAEKLIWKHLRNRSLEGVKFRRQQPFGPYIVDFLSVEKKLVVELDGGQHADANCGDAERDAYIKGEGYEVLRFWNNDVLQNTEGVLETIRLELIKPAPSPQPSPPEGRGS
jgi:very-short-patch-repair endonuclease